MSKGVANVVHNVLVTTNNDKYIFDIYQLIYLSTVGLLYMMYVGMVSWR